MNKYKNSLIKFIHDHNDVTIWTLLSNELKESTWLNRHEISLVKQPNNGLPFTLKISCPVNQARNSQLIVSKLSYHLARVISNLDSLIDNGYLVPTQPYNLAVPPGQTLFKIGTKNPNDGNVIYPDMPITQAIIQKANTEYLLSEDAKEFVKRGYLTQEESKFQKSSSLTRGILYANFAGLSLAILTLLISSISMCTSKNASEKMNTSLDSLNISANNLKQNLDTINTSFTGIESIIGTLDTSLTKTIATLDNEYSNLNSSVREINKTIISVSGATEKLGNSAKQFESTIEKIDYQYSRLPEISIKEYKCSFIDGQTVIENILIENKGNLLAEIESVEIQFSKSHYVSYESQDLEISRFSNSDLNTILRTKDNVSLKIKPKQIAKIRTKIILTNPIKNIQFKYFISYTSKNIDDTLSGIFNIECK